MLKVGEIAKGHQLDEFSTIDMRVHGPCHPSSQPHLGLFDHNFKLDPCSIPASIGSLWRIA